MTDAAALQKLLTWLSPAFPVGAFAWSAGLETAIAERRVSDATSLEDWIGGTLKHGGMRTDAIVLAHAWHIACGRPLHRLRRSPSPASRERTPDCDVGDDRSSTAKRGSGTMRSMVEGAAKNAVLMMELSPPSPPPTGCHPSESWDPSPLRRCR